jgi:hypothetical protein
MCWKSPAPTTAWCPLARSAAVLGRIVTAVEAFLDDHVWPV